MEDSPNPNAQHLLERAWKLLDKIDWLKQSEEWRQDALQWRRESMKNPPLISLAPDEDAEKGS